MGCTINNEEVCTEAIVGMDNVVRGLVGTFVVFGGCVHEAKVDEEFSTTLWQRFGRKVGSLFPNVNLFFKVNVVEGVVFKRRRSTQDVLWEDVQLMFARQTKTERPDLRLHLSGTAGRGKFGRTWGGGGRPFVVSGAAL